ncbi:BlaI family transcriptional regulator [Capsulimonas corticalis]|uniref:BlaI family transcriptional regulator n=1 Tax=Capsulimonas corticalis TaxID=2219043 RepID=A0A402D1S0_9BACT|nr:BlaI/MecI/CopY family transcriptional regulator [Capsulimonas corticalis]BDI28676.1 BlaI family transcriptional regulator [Capsulimonas corticalis]
MSKPLSHKLSRRERQIMDIVYQHGQASAAQVMESMPDAPSYSAVRALLRILEDKGHLRHIQEGAHYVFLPTQPRQSAARSAIEQVVQTFFGGSVERAVSTLLSDDETQLSDRDIARLTALIAQAKAEEAKQDS